MTLEDYGKVFEGKMNKMNKIKWDFRNIILINKIYKMQYSHVLVQSVENITRLNTTNEHNIYL